MGFSQTEAAPDWYASAYNWATLSMPWADRTEEEVRLVLEALRPRPGARILDLACGVGRHSSELSRRGFGVVGVDISSELIELATLEAERDGLDVDFIPADLRDVVFEDEFDVVLNLHDGAIGYFEDDWENRRTFEMIARALRSGGWSLAQIPNVLFAEAHLPEKTWTLGSEIVELLERHWTERAGYIEGEMTPIRLDDTNLWLHTIVFRQRLYTIEELRRLYGSVGMSLMGVLDGDGTPINPTDSEREIVVVAQKS